MEEQLVQLLSATQSSSEGPRKAAEAQLQSLYGHSDFAIGLVAIASHDSVPLNTRQAALLYLKTFVLATWSPQLDEFKGRVLMRDEEKARVRAALLDLATSEREDRKIKSAASYVVSKIANADFPDEWPDLLPKLMHLIPNGTDGQLHGALKVLDELVDDCFNEEQFFNVARDLVKVVYDVAVNDSRKTTLRALAVSVFRGCFDILEMVMEDHKAAVKAFADEALSAWTPFFIQVMKSRLPSPPSEDDENQDTGSAEAYRGLVALKLQVVKVCCSTIMDLRRRLLESILGPHEDTVSVSSNAITAKPRPIHRNMGRIVVTARRLPSNVYRRGASEPSGRCGWPAIYPGFPRSGRVGLHASVSPSVSCASGAGKAAAISK